MRRARNRARWRAGLFTLLTLGLCAGSAAGMWWYLQGADLHRLADFTGPVFEVEDISEAIPQGPQVSTVTARRGPQSIEIEVSGAVVPERSVTLTAPFAGTAMLTHPVSRGTILQPETPVFQMDTTKLDLASDRLKAELAELYLQQDTLEGERRLTLARMESAKEMQALARKQLNKQEEILSLEERLFAHQQELEKRKTLAPAAFLAAQSRLLGAELGSISAQRHLERAVDQLNALRLELGRLDHQKLLLAESRKVIEMQIEEIQAERARAVVYVDFPCQVDEVFVDRSQDVGLGTPLVRVRSMDAVEIAVQVPDHHFRWLYAGELLDEPQRRPEAKRAIDVILRTADFRKVFPGAYVKSIGSYGDNLSSGLSIILGRHNPLRPDGSPEPSQELRPGMQCHVSLTLAEAPDAFRIPRLALQADRTLYHVLRSSLDASPQLAIIRDVELLHETEDELIVRLPEAMVDLLLVSEPLTGWPDGTPVLLAGMRPETPALR